MHTGLAACRRNCLVPGCRPKAPASAVVLFYHRHGCRDRCNMDACACLSGTGAGSAWNMRRGPKAAAGNRAHPDDKGIFHDHCCRLQVFCRDYATRSLDLCSQVIAMSQVQGIRTLCADGIQQVGQVSAGAASLVHCWRPPAALPIRLVEGISPTLLLH